MLRLDLFCAILPCVFKLSVEIVEVILVFRKLDAKDVSANNKLNWF